MAPPLAVELAQMVDIWYICVYDKYRELVLDFFNTVDDCFDFGIDFCLELLEECFGIPAFVVAETGVEIGIYLEYLFL